jgi:hypothetical protein
VKVTCKISGLLFEGAKVCKILKRDWELGRDISKGVGQGAKLSSENKMILID